MRLPLWFELADLANRIEGFLIAQGGSLAVSKVLDELQTREAGTVSPVDQQLWCAIAEALGYDVKFAKAEFRSWQKRVWGV